MILFWVKEMVPHREGSARRPGKALCSCSTDPLVTSAAYILFITDQKGIFHGSAFIRFPYFPEISSQFCSQGENMGVIPRSGCPSRHCLLCACLYVDLRAGDTEVSGHCVCESASTCAVPWEPRVACPCQLVLQLCKILLRFCTCITSVCFKILLAQHPAWWFLFEAPGFSLHTASVLFAELSLMNLSGSGGFIELGKIYGFQPWF